MKSRLALLALAGIVSGCMAAPPPPPPMAPPPPPAAAGASVIGKGSKPGFCTFKDASGVVFEKKC